MDGAEDHLFVQWRQGKLAQSGVSFLISPASRGPSVPHAEPDCCWWLAWDCADVATVWRIDGKMPNILDTRYILFFEAGGKCYSRLRLLLFEWPSIHCSDITHPYIFIASVSAHVCACVYLNVQNRLLKDVIWKLFPSIWDKTEPVAFMDPRRSQTAIWMSPDVVPAVTTVEGDALLNQVPVLASRNGVCVCVFSPIPPAVCPLIQVTCLPICARCEIKMGILL